MTRIPRRSPALTGCALLLAACGGGGGEVDGDADGGDGAGGGGGDPLGSIADLVACYGGGAGPTGDHTTATLEFYGGSLNAVDPGNPAALPKLIDSAARTSPAPVPVLDGAWQMDGGVTSPTVARVVYQDGSNHLRQVDTDPNASQSPVRMSSEDQAVDAFRVGHDFANPQDACIAYRLESDGDWKITRLGAGGATAPGDLPGIPIASFHEADSGAHDGWLLLVGGELRRVSGNGSVGGGLGSGINAVELLDRLPGGTAFLNVDGSLFAYEPANDQLIDFNHTFPANDFSSDDYFVIGGPELAVTDASDLYFVDDFELYRADPSSATVEMIDTPSTATKAREPSPDSTSVDRLTVTPDRVVWSAQSETLSGEFQEIRSVAKATLATTVLEVLDRNAEVIDRVDRDNQAVLARGGDWFFYTRRNASTGAVTAVAHRADDSGSPIEVAGAAWFGADVNPRPSSNLADAVLQMYRVRGITSSSQPSDGTLESVPATSPGSPVTLGSLPSNIPLSADPLPLAIGGGIGPARLGRVAVDAASGREDDVIFIESGVASSYERITNENGDDEVPVPLF